MKVCRNHNIISCTDYQTSVRYCRRSDAINKMLLFLDNKVMKSVKKRKLLMRFFGSSDHVFWCNISLIQNASHPTPDNIRQQVAIAKNRFYIIQSTLAIADTLGTSFSVSICESP